jgi:hypothetical protein
MAKPRAPSAHRPDFTIAFLDPHRLEPHPENWKRHNPRQRDALSQSLAEFGWLSAPILNQRTGRLLDGHERREEAIARGWAEIPVRVVDVSLSQERRILAAFDRLQELRETDDLMLARLLQATMDDGSARPPGYSDAEMDDFLAKLLPAETEASPAGTEAFYEDNPHVERLASAAPSDLPPEPTQAALTGAVRLINLYLTPAQHTDVLAKLGPLAEVYHTGNITDTVVAAIDVAWEQQDARSTSADTHSS